MASLPYSKHVLDLPVEILGMILSLLDYHDRLNFVEAYANDEAKFCNSHTWKNLVFQFTNSPALSVPKSNCIAKFGRYFTDFQLSFYHNAPPELVLEVLRKVGDACPHLQMLDLSFTNDNVISLPHQPRFISAVEKILTNDNLKRFGLAFQFNRSVEDSALVGAVLSALFLDRCSLTPAVHKLEVYQENKLPSFVFKASTCSNLQELSCQIYYLSTDRLHHLLVWTRLQHLMVFNDRGPLRRRVDFDERHNIDWIHLARIFTPSRLQVSYVVVSRDLHSHEVVANPFMRSFVFLYGGPTAKTVLAVLERFAPTLRSFAVYGSTDLHVIVPDRMVEVLKKTKYLDTMVLGVEVPQELLLKMCAQRKFKNLHVKYSEMVVDADYFESTVSDRKPKSQSNPKAMARSTAANAMALNTSLRSTLSSTQHSRADATRVIDHRRRRQRRDSPL